MSAVETSILQSASDLQIVEGHFSSIGRDSSSLTARDVYSITINNHHHTPSPNPSDSDSSSRSNPTGVSEIPVDQNVEGISPGQSGSRRSSSEAVAESTLIIQRNCDIYRYHLATQGRGLPLWIPEPSQGLPIPYQRQGISMGDVGVVTASGGFTYLFNIFRPTHHPINPPIMPDGFKPLRFIYAFDSVLSRRDLTDKGYFASPSNVQARRDRGTANFVFESSECNGAILAIPLGGKSEDLACIARLRKYVAANMTSWYRYACVCRGMEIQNGDLKVVIGCDKTSAWGMACLGSSAHPRSPSPSTRGSGESRRFYLEFGPAESHSRRGGRYEWAYSGEVAEMRAGPGAMEVALLRMVSGDTDSGEGDSQDDGEYYENQCLFLRTMNATLPEEVWQQVALEEEEEEESNDEETWKEEEDHVDPPHAYGSLGYRGSADRRSGISGQGRPNRGGMQSESGDPLLTLLPSEAVDSAGLSSATSVSRSNIALDASNMASNLASRLMSLVDHPSISINRFLLSNSSSQTTMAISVDQDWMSAIREDDVTLPSSEELLKRILESHRVCEIEGVVFLEPKNTDETTVPPAVIEGETEDYDYVDNVQELEPTMTEVEDLGESNRYDSPDDFEGTWTDGLESIPEIIMPVEPDRSRPHLVRSYPRLVHPYPTIDVHSLSFLPSYSPQPIEAHEPPESNLHAPDIFQYESMGAFYSLDLKDEPENSSTPLTGYDGQSSGANIATPTHKLYENPRAGDAHIGKEAKDGLQEDGAGVVSLESKALRKKTEENATAFSEKMADFIKQQSSTDLTTDISDTLEMVLKGHGNMPSEESTLTNPFDEFFNEFFDVSFGEGSKTPDLISSSSANPSISSNNKVRQTSQRISHIPWR